MVKKTKPLVPDTTEKSDEIFARTAAMFRVMSAPMRLRIISALCKGEKNVGELLDLVPTTQPNMSQHLSLMHRAGLLGKRREGVQIYYFVANEKMVSLCRAFCDEIRDDSLTSA